MICTFLLINKASAAQIDPINSGFLKTSISNPAQAVNRINATILVDTFNPLTHYKDGDLYLSASPVYFMVERLRKGGAKDQVRGEDMNGYALALSTNYAITDHWQITAGFTGVRMKGDAIEEGPYRVGFTETVVDKFRNNCENSSEFYQLGLGFDPLHGSNWSIPILIGGYAQHYKSDIYFNSLVPDYPNTVSKESGMVYGITAAVAFSWKFDIFNVFFKLTPYVMVIHPLTLMDMKATIVSYPAGSDPWHNQFIGSTITRDNVGNTNVLPGLRFAYVSESNISVAVSISGLAFTQVNFYNDALLSGLKLTTFLVSVSYQGNVL